MDRLVESTLSPPPRYPESSKSHGTSTLGGSTLVSDIGRRRPERFEHVILKPWVVFGLTSLMAFFGVAVEIALLISREKNGFPVPKTSIFTFASASFITSFFPTLLMVPLAFAWSETDWALRSLQPYVVLARGNARAEDSLLLDYIAHGKLRGLFTTLRKRHFLLHLSILTALSTGFLQPLGGSIFSIKQLPFTTDITVTARSDIGLTPDFASLNAFLAAAGFTEAAAFQGLPDPPFVHANWSAAEFELPPNPGLNATITLNTTGIRTTANCGNPINTTLTQANNVTFTASFSSNASQAGNYDSGCSGSLTFDPTSADQQYGVMTADAESCGLPADTPTEFLPVIFWFFHRETEDQGKGPVPQARGVFCRPWVEVFNAEVTVNQGNGSLANVKIMDEYLKPNNVSGSPLNGQGFNAVVLDALAGNNSFVQARATSIRTGLPGAIFRFASQGDIHDVFNSEVGFLDLTERIYTQHLSVSSKSIYFVPSTEVLTGKKTALVDRLIVDPLAAHLLAILLISLAAIGAIIHTIHLRERRRMRLDLTSEPGTIAHTIALSTQSQIGQRAGLDPRDTKDDLKQKLQGMKFALDVNGNIIVEGDQAMSFPVTPRSPSGFGEKISLLRIGKMDYDEMSSRSATPTPSVQTFSINDEELLVNPHGPFSSPRDTFVNPHDFRT